MGHFLPEALGEILLIWQTDPCLKLLQIDDAHVLVALNLAR
jgi:hypothetical protein